MNENELLAERFEVHRSRLRAVAFRVLGSASEADDAVQDAWLRLSRTGDARLDNLAAWLTTVVARVSLNMLRSRNTRREDALDTDQTETVDLRDGADPEHQALLTNSVGLALMVVLDTLTPAERVAFVLHDMFAVPYDEIAPVVERTPTATRQLASRARRRVEGAPVAREAESVQQRDIVAAFLAASRDGDFDALLALLDPDIVLQADGVAVRQGAEQVQGARAVARFFTGRAQAAQPVLLNGVPGLAWAPGGKPRVVFGIAVKDGTITAIDLLAEPCSLDRILVEFLDG